MMKALCINSMETSKILTTIQPIEYTTMQLIDVVLVSFVKKSKKIFRTYFLNGDTGHIKVGGTRALIESLDDIQFAQILKKNCATNSAERLNNQNARWRDSQNQECNHWSQTTNHPVKYSIKLKDHCMGSPFLLYHPLQDKNRSGNGQCRVLGFFY